jgi:aspartyl-tRNA(Asn)/glutamyl-tRNA(Gln) amidotransferase subunit C
MARMSDSPPTITRDEVAKLAGLARIDLTDAELDLLAPQLSVIVESVAAVSQVAADDIPPSSHALPMQNVRRADEVRPSLPPEEALAGAPESEQQRFKVPRILGEEQ